MFDRTESTIPVYILDDLYLRFLQDITNQDIFSNLENMHWFYLDQFYMVEPNILPNVDLIDFCTQVFQRYPKLVPKSKAWEYDYDAWRQRKNLSPTSSAVILNNDLSKVLLVKGFKSNKWTFPGGKIEKGETTKECAIRECEEEIGYNIREQINETFCIKFRERNISRSHYIITNVSQNIKFKPITRHEIKNISWFLIDHLPTSKYEDCYDILNVPVKDFLSVMRTIRIIKKWIELIKSGVTELDALKRAEKIDYSSEQVPIVDKNQTYNLFKKHGYLRHRIYNEKDSPSPFLLTEDQNHHIKIPIYKLDQEAFNNQFDELFL